MISRQPALRNAVPPLILKVSLKLVKMQGTTYVFNDVAVVADEQISTAVLQVDLHPDQPVGMTWQVMQRNPLAEIERSLVEGLPVAKEMSVRPNTSTLQQTYRSSLR